MFDVLVLCLLIWMIADELIGRVRTGRWPTITRLRELPLLRRRLRDIREQSAKLKLETAAIREESVRLRAEHAVWVERFEWHKIVTFAIMERMKAGAWHGDDSIVFELADETNQPLDIVFEELDQVRTTLAETFPGPLLHHMFNRRRTDDI